MHIIGVFGAAYEHFGLLATFAAMASMANLLLLWLAIVDNLLFVALPFEIFVTIVTLSYVHDIYTNNTI